MGSSCHVPAGAIVSMVVVMVLSFPLSSVLLTAQANVAQLD
jgi:hypothetical protein